MPRGGGTYDASLFGFRCWDGARPRLLWLSPDRVFVAPAATSISLECI